MKKIIALLLLLAMTFSLAACSGTPPGGDSEIPEGMKIAEEGEGYTLFVPEDWVVETSTGVTMAYVSTVDPSNVTLLRVTTDKTPAAYFAENERTLASVLEEYVLLEARDDTTFGGEPASVRVYTGKVAGVEYKYMQFLVQKAGILTLFTYTAKTEIPSGNVSYYDRYIANVLGNDKTVGMANVFLFTGTEPEEMPTPPEEVVKNEDGLILVSDPAVSHYSLYAPGGWGIDLRNGTTSISTNAAAVTVTYEIPVEASIGDFWEARRATYAEIYEDFAVIEAECSLPAEKREDVEIWLDGHQAVRYVYTFTHGGVAYKTQKLLALDGLYVYSLTLTARADAYDAAKADFEAMIAAFTFD